MKDFWKALTKMSLLTRELHKKSMLKKSELVDKVQDDKFFGFKNN